MPLLAAATAAALDPSRAISQYVHESWLVDDGLPQSSVMAIVQAPSGYLWLATQEGVVRFDGMAFTVFDRQTLPGLPSNDIRAIHAAPSGDLWLGTWGGGLVRVAGGRATAYSTEAGLPHTFVNALAADSRGTLWIGTNRGAARMDLATPGRLEPVAGLEEQTVRSILEGSDDVIRLAASHGGVYRIGAGRTAVRDDQVPVGGATALFEARDRALWVGTVGEGLLRLAPADGSGARAVQRFPTAEVNSIAGDRDGTVWVATTAGLLRVVGGAVSEFRARDGLGDDYVWVVREDREGSVWVGTSVAGLHRFKEGRFTPLTTDEGLGSDYVRVVFPVSDGSIWIGTYGAGVSRVEGKTITRLSARDGLAGDNVRSIAEDRSGAIWVATMTGLSRVQQGRVTNFGRRDGLRADFAWSLEVDSRGDLWIGPDGGGVHLWRGADPRRALTFGEEIQQPVRCILEDRSGAVWLGTYGDGLYRSDRTAEGDGPPRLTRFGVGDGLADDTVFALHEDASGILWIATDHGLSRLRDGHFASITSREGLLSDTIFQVLEDASGWLWLTSNKGIFRVARADLDACFDGRLERVTPVVYGRADGLRSTECNGGWPAGCRLPNGQLWFPTIAGVAIVDPARVVVSTEPPPVVVEAVTADDRPLEPGPEVRVDPGARRLRFAYASLTLLWPQAVRYRYRLDGFDHGWTEAGRSRVAEYTNMPPGRYRFRVVACSSDGVWSREEAVVAVEVRPFLYQTVWFRVLIGILLLGAALVAHRLRVRRLRRHERELEELVRVRTAELRQKSLEAEAASRAKSVYLANMSHEIRTPLNTLIGFSEILLGKLDGQVEPRYLAFLGHIQTAGRHLLALINDILDLAKVEAGRMDLFREPVDVAALVHGVRALMTGMARKCEVEIVAEVAEGLPKVEADPARLKQVLFNLLSNAVKFSRPGGTVTVTARLLGVGDDEAACPVPRPALELAVVDHGVGIRREDHERIFDEFRQVDGAEQRQFAGTGLGLALVRRLVELHGGRVVVESELGAGSTFRVFLPVTGEDSASPAAAAGESVYGVS